MNYLIFLAMVIGATAWGEEFETENEPVTQAQFEAQQKKHKAEEKKNAAKYPAVPSAGALMQTGKNGAVYRMMFTGSNMIGFKCGWHRGCV